MEQQRQPLQIRFGRRIPVPLRFISMSGMERTETLRPAAKIKISCRPRKMEKIRRLRIRWQVQNLLFYQVHDADWLSKYYSGAAATEQEETEYKNAFDATKYYTDNNNGTYTVNYTAYATKKTDSDGKVQFGKATATEAGIPLGLYLVIETENS